MYYCELQCTALHALQMRLKPGEIKGLRVSLMQILMQSMGSKPMLISFHA